MKNSIRLASIVIFVISCLLLMGCDNTTLPCSFEVPDSTYPNSDLASALIVYPCNIDSIDGPIGATTLSGGIYNTKEDMYWIAEYLRDEGDLIVIAMSASNNTTVNSYEKAQKAGVNILKELNRTSGNQIYQKVGKIAVMGWSMGGAGALHTANDMGDEISAAIALAPWNAYNLSGISVPTAILVGGADVVAPPTMALNTYRSLPDVPKSFAKIDGKSHQYWKNNSNGGETGKIYILSWLKYYLSDDDSYYDTLMSPPLEVIDYDYYEGPSI